MAQIVERAPALEYLSNDDVSMLSKELRKIDHAIPLCDAFAAIAKKRDWRLMRR